MARQFSLATAMKIVQLLAPTTTNGGATSRRVSVKGAHKAFIVIDLKQAVGHGTVLTLTQATAVTAGSTAAGPVSQNWLNEDTVTNDVLVKKTDLGTITVDTNAKSKQAVFEVDPSALADGKPYLFVTTSDSSQATNFVSVVAYLLPRYQSSTATQPTAVA